MPLAHSWRLWSGPPTQLPVTVLQGLESPRGTTAPVQPRLTWPEDGQGAVLVQPGQRRPVQLFQAAGGHHPLEGLKQRLDDDTELHGTWVKEKINEEEGQCTRNRGVGRIKSSYGLAHDQRLSGLASNCVQLLRERDLGRCTLTFP